MPITISGSTGIAGVDGSASTPAVQGTDTNTGIAFPAADTVAVATGGSERMRVDSSGNVGIGTSSPSYRLDVRATAGGVGAVVAGANAGGNAQINVNSTFSSTSPVYGFFFNGTTGIGNPASNVISAITAGTETMRIDTSGNLLFNSGYGSVATAYGCRAWVNFNGTGVVAIRASGNVTSITDNGTGDYTVNFTNAMPDANYASITNAANTASDNWTFSPYVSTTTSVRSFVRNGSNSSVDASSCNVAILR